jgi:hypothetical protein
LAGPTISGSNLQLFLTRAAEARREGDAATLEHVRERCRRSEAAWNALADKARRSERLREEEQKRKAALAAQTTNEDTIPTIPRRGRKAPQPAPDGAPD